MAYGGLIMEVWRRNIEFLNELARRPNPEWYSRNEIVMSHPAFFLRKFGSGGKETVVIVPPQAGHSSTICDFDAGQSLVQTALNFGHNVYVIDWKSCTPERKDEGIDDLVLQVRDATKNIRGPFTLVGLCQGGWLSAIFAASFPERVKHLLVAGAPINAKAGGGYLQQMVQSLPQEFYEGLVDMGGGLMRGEFMLLGWKMMNLFDRTQDYFDLWCAIGTDRFRKIQRFRDWYEYTQDLAGRYYLESVDRIFRKNDLWEGRLRVLGATVNLKDISCPITSIAGEGDDITLVPQALALPGTHVLIPEVGHIGIFMSRKAQKYWEKIWRKKAADKDEDEDRAFDDVLAFFDPPFRQ